MANSSALKQRTLLLGVRGMIGSALARLLSGPNLFAFSHQELDITDYAALEKSFLRCKPELVLNAAAFTRVDDCERLREVAFLVNAQAPGQLGGICKKYNSHLVHLSTDYVFDGALERPYSENHVPNPVNYYGTTKWEGEKKILASGCSSLIVRSSWIFGPSGDNFVKKILKRALAGAKLEAPTDQIGSPTYAVDVAHAVLRLLSVEATGTYHFTSTGYCSRWEQARSVLKLYGLNNAVEPVKNDTLSLPARRPHFSVLDISLYKEKTGQTPRMWEESTAEYIAFLKQNEHELRS